MFALLKKLFSNVRDYTPNPSATAQQKRALAAGAIVTEVNQGQHEWLHGEVPDQVDRRAIAEALRESWSVRDRATLLATLEWLEREGHRVEYESMRHLFATRGEYQRDASELLAGDAHAQTMSAEAMIDFRARADAMLDYWKANASILAWDLGRAIHLCRWGAAVGYLSDDEAWQRITEYAHALSRQFGSWAEFGVNYRAGHAFWSRGAEDGHIERALEQLLDANDRDSPWNLSGWSAAAE